MPTGKDDFALFQLPQLPLDGDVVPAGDGLENSIPRWPPAGPIEPIASLLAQGINRVLVTAGGSLIEPEGFEGE